MYISKNKRLRTEIIQLYYNIPVAEHGRQQKTIELVIRNYWWLGVTKDVGKYVDSYNLYQRIKNKIEILAEKLIANKVLKRLQTYLMVDLITKLSLVVGKDTILVICNRLFKMIYFIVITEEILPEELARLFQDNVWKLYELLESVISNRRPQFVAVLDVVYIILFKI